MSFLIDKPEYREKLRKAIEDYHKSRKRKQQPASGPYENLPQNAESGQSLFS